MEIAGTDVSAATIHTLFDLDTEFKSKLDFAKLSNTRVADVMSMDVLLAHRDGNNLGVSLTRSFGDFAGGQLLYWGEDDGLSLVEKLRGKTRGA